MKYVWVGKRESDILTYNYFDFSITFWGSCQNSNISFCQKTRYNDSYSNQFTQFVIINMKKLKNEYVDVLFHFYNNSFAYKIISLEPSLKESIINKPTLYALNTLRHKALSRVWLSNTINTPAYALLSKEECNYKNLTNKFGNSILLFYKIFIQAAEKEHFD